MSGSADPREVLRRALLEIRSLKERLAAAERLAQASKALGACLVGVIRHEYGEKPVTIGDEVLPFEVALAFAGALLAEREKTTKPRIGGPVGRIDQH